MAESLLTETLHSNHVHVVKSRLEMCHHRIIMLSENILTTGAPRCFQFKASFSPCTIWQLFRYDLAAIESQLSDLVRRTPAFFQGAPVVIDLEKVGANNDMDFVKLKQALVSGNLVPIGIRNGSPEQQKSAMLAGLPSVSIGNSTNKKNMSPKPDETAAASKLITTPIRSGVQVYANKGDLIVTSQVSAGAEVMADGHIHIYNTLRGRALAGVKGNIHARIFCRHLEAELVSIAGYYLTQEDIQSYPNHIGMIQIYLNNEKIHIEPV